MSKPQVDQEAKTIFGFWLYLMTDCVLFASLFATFAVLRNNTFGGPGGEELFSLPFVLLETMITLVGTHGLHITIGLTWMASMMAVVWRRGLDDINIRRLICLSLFWHFLDIIWIFIFSIVYLLGAG
jgi:heme/copper-type cytochrome/quinol oxidase subunit 3